MLRQLRSRIESLQRQSGTSPETSHSEGSDDTPGTDKGLLRERLHRLAAPRLSSPSGRSRPSDAELAGLLHGEHIADGLILVESFFPLGTSHGKKTIEGGLSDALALFGQYKEEHDGAVVFMDTETTGLAGGTGTLVFLLGLGRLTPDGLRVHQYFLTGFTGEAAMLGTAAEFLEGARTLVTFNGKGFDSPLLAARYRLAGMPDPFEPLHHLDLLHPTRCAFASRWDNCRLQSAERILLGFARVDDLPGSEAPEAWFQWVRLGITQRLPRLVEHNRWDVVSLTTLLSVLHEAHERPSRYAADTLAIARHRGRQKGDNHAHAYLLSNEGHLDTPGLLELARLYRRRGAWSEATAIWHTLADQAHPEALERLAKYYEHIARDIEIAQSFTARLQTLEPSDPGHQRRRARLQEKLAGTTADQTPIDRTTLPVPHSFNKDPARGNTNGYGEQTPPDRPIGSTSRRHAPPAQTGTPQSVSSPCGKHGPHTARR